MSRRGVGFVLAVALLAVAGCSNGGDKVREHLRDTYERVEHSGDTEVFSADDPIGTATAGIVGVAPPAARQADGGNEYLRYDGDIVIVSPAAGGGSTVRVEDLGGRYSSGFFAFLGPGFNPGSPAGRVGGPGGAK